MAAKIRWLSVREVYAFHDLALSEHGGMPGLRDAGLLESAVLRPRTAYEYGTSDLAELAAKLAFGLISNHAFFDGNKRASLTCQPDFLALERQKVHRERKRNCRAFDRYGQSRIKRKRIDSLVQTANRITEGHDSLVGRSSV